MSASAITSATERRARRRRRHEEVRDTLSTAALELLDGRSFKDVTVDDVARRAGLSRPAFYFYFRDKHDLLMALTADLADGLYREADRWWHGGAGEPRSLIREALRGAASVYARHAGVVRAATEVATYDPEVRDFWRELVQRFIDATAEHLRRERAAGRVGDLEPISTSEALIWMTERYCYVYLATGERPVDELVESLTAVWMAALYGQR